MPVVVTSVLVPACFSTEVVVDRNRARQLLAREQSALLSVGSGGRTISIGGRRYRILGRRTALASGERALLVPSAMDLEATPDLRGAKGVRWFGHLAPDAPRDVLRSLRDAFQFRGDDPGRGIAGLRDPQLGAVHAVLGYWTTRASQPATVVMPTGTGKTETMLALFAATTMDRLLVVVPSDALRDQIARKFESFGVLQEFAVVDPKALRPVVGLIRHGFHSEVTARRFAEACNVVVTTPSALSASTPEVRTALLAMCSHLFVDEAHHVAATTWREIRDAFEGRPVVQFTATPFREDGRHLGGHLLYAFPLKEAQRQGYFSKINYISVVDFDNPEGAIAQRAIAQLRQDLDAGLDHILMARVKRIGRAQEVLALYGALAGDLNPVIVHSNTSRTVRDAALSAIRSRTSRVIVCVDMLGEGFDLPALKIAAIHDAHKSLGVTLQFVGRFARVTGATIGEATVVVGRPDLDYDDTLRRLYAEDADWNLLISDLSDKTVGHQQEISDFEAAFTARPDEVSLRNLLPKMSTVVYRANSSAWKPAAISEIFPEGRLLTYPVAVNPKDGVAWFVTEERTQVRWGDIKTIEEVAFDLYVLYWDSSKRLLYINSSNNDSLHEELAKAVCGDTSERIRGEGVFRVMAQVRRLVPTNVGVLDMRNRARRFSMHVGADVSEGFPVAEAQTKTKTNIFAYGFEDGERVSVGASLKGRVWSHRVAGSLKEWVNWCDEVGAKLIDTSISVDEVMANFIRPQALENRPSLVALALEWPWELFLSTREEVRVAQGDKDWPLVDVDLSVTSHSTSGPIRFTVSTPDATSSYELDFVAGGMQFRAVGAEAYVVTPRTRTPLSTFLTGCGLIVHLEQDATIVPPGMLLKLERELPPYNASNLRVIDWTGVNLRKESQGPGRDADSIQAKMIEHLQSLGEWDLIIDDDGSGEIADIVALRLSSDELHVQLVHCKFSGSAAPGARVEDLYDVCGQAQKSGRWKRNTALMFRHLIRREKNRKERQGRTGVIVGDGNKLYEIEDKSRFVRHRFSIAAAQPGLAKSRVSAPMLELLASTDVYLHETALAEFDVFCSE